MLLEAGKGFVSVKAVTGEDGDAMTITWNKVDNATSYNVYGYPGLTNEIKDKVEVSIHPSRLTAKAS